MCITCTCSAKLMGKQLHHPKYMYINTCISVYFINRIDVSLSSLSQRCLESTHSSSVYMHDLIIHEMPRKKGKATQHNSPKAVIFLRKKLPRVGLEPTTMGLLGDALTN